ncbi:OsmC family protein [Lentilactobacillus buchneri]|uniref:OsmC family protein n=1 Tax=Lentilactobacillus buchneri TaxID=1581 RepID=UPI0010ABEC1F|nr:OsmC family protein [Lentilactobacillus buchneri]TJY02910.1 OsmC family protein [Lentilactobacillus buchneri]TJY08170.1 OsmC family protein [Lentilactobacillus buchneri]TJY11253.1 OsmC family protein [Lentilactobacillus buchneri]TJY18859.1 OsmC family protein [Lentilactobacillus buchneri]TJY22752.1 OsmC family protein [Lentilactobacillus buchneri]
MGKYIISSKLRKVGAQVDTKTGIHQFIVDEPIAGYGTDAGPNPVQYLLSAVGSCLAITANDIARKHPEIQIKKFETKTTGETTQYQDGRSAVTKIVVQIHAETNLDEAGHKAFMHSVVKDCTVHETLKHAVPIELQFI